MYLVQWNEKESIINKIQINKMNWKWSNMDKNKKKDLGVS